MTKKWVLCQERETWMQVDELDLNPNLYVQTITHERENLTVRPVELATSSELFYQLLITFKYNKKSIHAAQLAGVTGLTLEKLVDLGYLDKNHDLTPIGHYMNRITVHCSLTEEMFVAILKNTGPEILSLSIEQFQTYVKDQLGLTIDLFGAPRKELYGKHKTMVVLS